MRSMTSTQKWTIAAAVGILVVASAVPMLRNTAGIDHHNKPLRADAAGGRTDVSDAAILQALKDANLSIDNLEVHNVGGIVVMRGNAPTSRSARAVDVIKHLGFTRVANLVIPAAPFDDEHIRQDAERQLAGTRALDGCSLSVSCNQGLLRVGGTVQNELQKDA